MAVYTPSEELEALGKKVIRESPTLMHLDDTFCRIAYQYSSQEKIGSSGRHIYADTQRISEKVKAYMPYDFLVTFYKPNTDTLDEERMRRLMYHELKHIGFNGKGKYFIVPHDVNDFREVIDQWGFDWIK